MFLLLKQIGTSLVSTNTVFFDFHSESLTNSLRLGNCFLHLIIRENCLGKLPLHSFLGLSLFKSSLNTLSTSLNSLSELSYLHTGGKKAVHLTWDSVAYRVAMARQCKAGSWQTLFSLSWLKTNCNLRNTCKISIKIIKYYFKIHENISGITISETNLVKSWINVSLKGL